LGGNTQARNLRVIDAEESPAGTTGRIEGPGAEAPGAGVINTDGTVKSVYYTSEG
jgi:hypothetical protein